jgi:dipeptidyl-peptidase 4
VQQGWVVFSIDGRGTPDRGKTFEDAIYRSMSGVEVDDQLVGVNWLKKQDFVDPKRIAVYGWSYGGYMTLRLLQRAPGVFAAGVSGAPVTKWELYDTHYTERYMGTPQVDGAAYKKSSALESATVMSDPLLLIHGMADDNVVFENTTALMAKLQGAAKPFETMVYPGQTHRVAGPGVSVHLWRTILGFLDREVKAKPN